MESSLHSYLVDRTGHETMWGQSTDWVIRAKDEDEARRIANDPHIPDFEDESKAPLTVTEVPIDGPSECILWYGPDA